MLIIIAKLFYMQVVDNKYDKWSYNNSVRINTLYPSRGEIVDRNGMLLAQNKEAYALHATPKDIGVFDTTALSTILEINNHQIDSLLTKCKKYSYRKASLLIGELTQTQKLMVEELDIKGLHTEYRSVRSYPHNIAGNILGYISSVTQREIEKDNFYDIQDNTGKTGLEKTYEHYLRGYKGQSYQRVNVHGAVVDSYMDGTRDYPPVSGNNIQISIDTRIQKLGEQLLANKIGAVVAIEPSTGEILAMVSSPTYNPDLLIGSMRSKNYSKLIKDPRRPFVNRTVSGTYPPGSIFKIPVGLVALQDSIIDYNTQYNCYNGFINGNFKLGCHNHYTPLKLDYALQTSCNSYFCNAFRAHIGHNKYQSYSEGLDEWKKQISVFGFGEKLNSDIENESTGYIPDSKRYDRIYGKDRWNAISIISISIGQGEILATPLQMANLGATIANRGYYHTPHLVKDKNITDDFTVKNNTFISKEHFDHAVNAMWRSVNEEGTGFSARVDSLDICGKTGTVQNGSGKDHSVFLGFAPRDNPQIAIVTYIENGGFGASLASPISSLIIEKYLTDTITRTTLLKTMIDKKIEYPQYDTIEQ